MNLSLERITKPFFLAIERAKQRPLLFALIVIVDLAFLLSLGPVHFKFLPKAAQAQVEISQMLSERMKNITSPEQALLLEEQLSQEPAFERAYRELLKWAFAFLATLGVAFVASRIASWLLTHALLAERTKLLHWKGLVLRVVFLSLLFAIVGFVWLVFYTWLLQNAYYSLKPVIKPFMAHFLSGAMILVIWYFSLLSFASSHLPNPLKRAFYIATRNAKAVLPVAMASVVLIGVLLLDVAWLANKGFLIYFGVLLLGVGISITRAAISIAAHQR